MNKNTKVEWEEKGKIGGAFTWMKFNKLGDLSAIGRIPDHNLVVTAGLGEITGLALSDVGGTAFDYLEVGTDATAASAGQSALVAAITDSGLARAAGTGTQQTVTVANDTLQLTYTWSSISASKTIREVGVFNAASAGTMLARAVINVSATSEDTLALTYRSTLTSS